MLASPSRRSFLVGSTALVFSRIAWSQTQSGERLYWHLDDDGDTAAEAVSGHRDEITSRTGHAIWVGEGRERALRLDGYSVWVDHSGVQLNLKPSPITVCAWIALESYPVSEAAIVDAGSFRLLIDQWGSLLIAMRSGQEWMTLASIEPIPRSRWVHVGGTISPTGELTLLCNGAVLASTPASAPTADPEAGGQVLVGKSTASPVIAGVFPSGVLNGLIKDVRVYQENLPVASVASIASELRPLTAPNLEINGNWCGSDPQRPQYHAMPPRAWTNEPHGLVYFKSQYHLFYQKNANGPYWGNINWGHLTSPDLHRWTEQPVALSPEHGIDAGGCWSGSVIEHKGKLAIVYTSGDGHKATISLALSEDGIHFEKYKGNPIIPAPPQGMDPEFRDPFVWREGDGYSLIIGSAVKEVGGAALLYRSDDLVHWEFRKRLFVGDRETSGVFWEMPIFVKIGDKHVLIVCEVPGRASYWVGTWRDEVFTPITPEPHRLELFNHLLSPTPHVMSDGKIVTMGIIPDQRSPRACWRAGWAHLYSLPRQLSLDAHGWLEQRPWEGVAKWMTEPITESNIKLQERTGYSPPGSPGKCLHLRVIFKRESSRAVEVIVRRSPDDRERTVLRYEWEIGRLVLDRTKSSLDAEAKLDLQETTYFPLQEDVLDIEMYLDVSVLEVFVDQRSAFATRIYPSLEESDGVAMMCAGGEAQIQSVAISTPQVRQTA